MEDQQPEVLSSEPVAVPKSSRKRAVIAGIALVGVGALAGGIAASASSAGAAGKTPFAAPPSGAPTARPDRPFPGGPDGPGRFGAGLLGIGGRIEHGSAVVKAKDGSTKTVDLQNGKVTAVSDKALTVKSDDGFSQSYVVVASTRVTKDWQGSTASSIKTGDTVMVLATETGGEHQATLIADGVAGPRGGGGFKHFRGGPGHPGMPVPPAGAPATPDA